jgi:CheY-like chemotaxis protein
MISLLVIPFSVAGEAIHKADPIDLSTAVKIPLDGKIDFLEDSSRSVTPTNLLAPHNQSKFKPLLKDKNSFGVTQSAWWFRVQVDFSAIPNESRMLLIKNSLINDARLYRQNGEQIDLMSKAGIAYPADDRAVYDSLLIFPLEQQASITTYYLRIHNQGALQAPLEIWHPNELMGQRNIDHWIMGIYFGLILSMAIYNFFIGYSTKDKAYFYYVGYLLSLSLVISLNDGYGQLLLFPDSPYVAYMSINWSSAILIIFASLFTQSFLNSKKNTPAINYWLVANMTLAVLFLAADPFLSGFAKANLILLLILSFIASMLSAGIAAFIQQVPAAKFFLAAWISMLLGSLLLAFTKLDAIPYFAMAEYGLHIGTSIEAMLLSFALASKINRLEESRKLAEDKARRSLEQSNQTLQDSHRIKDDFFSLLSHELRTPMHGVSGIIELFSTDNLDNEQKEKLSFLNRSSIEMVSYIDNLLILSQLQSDSLTLNELPFSPEKVLQQIENRFNHEAQDQKIAFNFKYPRPMVAKVIGDKRVLSVITSQLLNEAFQKVNLKSISFNFDYQAFPLTAKSESNADTSTGSGSDSNSETLNAEQLDRQRRLLINATVTTETYHKEDPNYLPGNAQQLHYEPVTSRIKTEFSRNSARVLSTTKELQQKLIKLLNGTISEKKISSNVQEKQLNIEMIIKLSDEKPKDDHDLISSRSNAERLALVVDDNSVNRVVAEKYLQYLGYQVDSACDGKEAFEKSQNENFDFILMDCHMPVLNGFQATEKIRHGKNHTNVPIIAVTADVTKESADACENCGMNAILHKPMSIGDLQRQLMQQNVFSESEKAFSIEH